MFRQRGSDSDNVFFNYYFLVVRRRENPNIIENGPSSATEMAFRWPVDVSIAFFPGIWTSIAKESYSFVSIQGVGCVRTPRPHSGSVHGLSRLHRNMKGLKIDVTTTINLHNLSYLPL